MQYIYVTLKECFMKNNFEGLVNIAMNTKGELALVRADKGDYSHSDADKIWSDMLEHSKSTGCKPNTYSFFNAAEFNKVQKKVPYKESECLNRLTYSKFGKPVLVHYMPDADTSKTKRVTKLDRID
tara:strand:+ start:253 stop:630 length:378 start_codon:yes stop_codon:yes gene_type:complete